MKLKNKGGRIHRVWRVNMSKELLERVSLSRLFEYYGLEHGHDTMDYLFKYLMYTNKDNVKGYELIDKTFDLFDFYYIIKELNDREDVEEDDVVEESDDMIDDIDEGMYVDLETTKEYEQRRKLLISTLSYLEQWYYRNNSKENQRFYFKFFEMKDGIYNYRDLEEILENLEKDIMKKSKSKLSNVSQFVDRLVKTLEDERINKDLLFIDLTLILRVSFIHLNFNEREFFENLYYFTHRDGNGMLGIILYANLKHDLHDNYTDKKYELIDVFKLVKKWYFTGKVEEVGYVGVSSR